MPVAVTQSHELNPNRPADTGRFAARMAIEQHLPKALVTRITELYDGGLDVFEIHAITGVPLALIKLVLRGWAPP